MIACPKCHGINVCGIEVRGVYDGVLYWRCESCAHHWSRDWTGYGRRAEVAAEYVRRGNESAAIVRASP